jgi:hypothetical protein
MMKEYTPKYDVHRAKPHYPGKRGRKEHAKDWIRDRYYAYLKHRSQARFRKEEYNLTVDEWNELWTEAHWHRKGRGPLDLALFRKNYKGAWAWDNVILDENQHKSQYYAEDRNTGGRPKGVKNKPQ